MLTRRSFLGYGLMATLLTTTSLPAQTEVSLDFDPDTYETLDLTVKTDAGDVAVRYRYYKAIPYVARPVDLAYQSLNIAVPVEINGQAVDATLAPMLFVIAVGGYFPSSTVDQAFVGEEKRMGGPKMGAAPAKGEAPSGSAAMMAQGERVSNAQLALAAGYVIVEPSARGRTLVDGNGIYYGTAPAALVDLKAALRWLRHNAGKVPGDVNRIVTSGTSAGGALSTLVGATADLPEYLPYLAALGAAETSDAVAAVGAWCPITDLDHADMAYEWNWGQNPYDEGTLDRGISDQLAALFPAYQAGLNLSGKNGFGALTAETYGKYLVDEFLTPEATAFLAALPDPTEYLAANPNIAWDGTKAAFDWQGFLNHVGPRKKPAPAFDRMDLSSGENNLFGTGKTESRIFTAFTAQAAGVTLDADIPAVVALMNPMPALTNTARARKWWLRVGAKDSDTSLTVVGNLDAALRDLGDQVSTRYYWDAGHGANQDAGDFIAWIATI